MAGQMNVVSTQTLNETSIGRTSLNDERRITRAIESLDSWLEKADWKGYDTFDGLSSPLAPLLTFNNHFLRIAWQQSIRRFPLNLRPLLGVRPAKSSKAMGFLAQGYLTLYRVYGRQEFLDKAKMCLKWLIENPSPGYTGFCWGNHFSYESRSGTIAKGVPTIVWTSLIGQALLDAYDLLKERTYLDTANKIVEFLQSDIRKIEFPDSHCLAYTPGVITKETSLVHNANMLAAGFLGRMYSLNRDQSVLDMATRAVRFTVNHQLPDGAWIYAEGGRWNWIDSFHSGYVLESLHTYINYSGDRQFQPALDKGYRFFVDTFFGADGTPYYYHNKPRPLDIQCASQGIQTLVNLRALDDRSVGIAKKVALWTIDNMQDSTGYFHYRKYPWISNRTPTLHWGQATMLAALSLLVAHMREGERVPS
jgi:hypothetical protein